MFDRMVDDRLAKDPALSQQYSRAQLLEEQIKEYHNHPGFADGTVGW
jgi:hypothetical protein